MLKSLALITAAIILLCSGCATSTDIPTLMRQVANSCPGVGSSQVVSDQSHIGVTIAPGQYATSEDMNQAVANLIGAYQAIVKAGGYTGYLRVGIANRGPDGKYHIVQIIEVTPQGMISSKEQTYKYMVEGYLVNWPGPDPYDTFGKGGR
jgi:hypothetical protein